MAPLPRWRIWYDDESVIPGKTEREWEAAPRHGVLFIKHNRLTHMGLDYYWLENGTVKSCNRMDVDRYLERPQGIRCVKFGRWADNYVWEKVRKSVKDCGDC